MLTDYKISKIVETSDGTIVTMEVYEGSMVKRMVKTPGGPDVEKDVYERTKKLRTKTFTYKGEKKIEDVNIDLRLELKKDPVRKPVDAQKIKVSVSEIPL